MMFAANETDSDMQATPSYRISSEQILNGYTNSRGNIREEKDSAVGTMCRPFSPVGDFIGQTALLFSTQNKCQDFHYVARRGPGLLFSFEVS